MTNSTVKKRTPRHLLVATVVVLVIAATSAVVLFGGSSSSEVVVLQQQQSAAIDTIRNKIPPRESQGQAALDQADSPSTKSSQPAQPQRKLHDIRAVSPSPSSRSCASLSISDFLPPATARARVATAKKTCVRKLQHELGDRWALNLGEKVFSTAKHSKKKLPAALNNTNIPLILYDPNVARAGRMPIGQALFRKFVFEFYGDSTLRQMWQQLVSAYGGSATLGSDFKRLVNVSYRGPHYAAFPVAAGKPVDEATRCAVCPDVQRTFFRFDFLPGHLTSSEFRTTQPVKVPTWFQPTERAFNASSHHDSSNNMRPKMIYFSFGIHYVFQFATNTSVGMNPSTTFDEGRSFLKETLREGLKSYLTFLGSRNNLQFLTLVESRLDCGGMTEYMKKKVAMDCKLFNQYIEFLSQMVFDVASSVRLTNKDEGPAAIDDEIPTTLQDRLFILKGVERPGVTKDGMHLRTAMEWLHGNAALHIAHAANGCVEKELGEPLKSKC